MYIAVAFGEPFEGRVLNYDGVWKILYERIINCSPKFGIFTCEILYLEGAPKNGGPEASASLAFPLTHQITLITILCENI